MGQNYPNVYKVQGGGRVYSSSSSQTPPPPLWAPGPSPIDETDGPFLYQVKKEGESGLRYERYKVLPFTPPPPHRPN